MNQIKYFHDLFEIILNITNSNKNKIDIKKIILKYDENNQFSQNINKKIILTELKKYYKINKKIIHISNKQHMFINLIKNYTNIIETTEKTQRKKRKIKY